MATISLNDEYLLDALKKEFKVEMVLEDALYVIYEKEDHWMDLVFVEYIGESDEGVSVRPLFRSSGPGGVDCPLRECRHTTFVADGYMFYMNKGRMVAALDYCSKYWDMD